MTDFEILKKAVEKAVKNGFEWRCVEPHIPSKEFMWRVESEHDVYIEGNGYSFLVPVYDIIFSHAFAVTFWGEGLMWYNFPRGNLMKLPAWQIHLQQMVLEEDRLKYLERFL